MEMWCYLLRPCSVFHSVLCFRSCLDVSFWVTSLLSLGAGFLDVSIVTDGIVCEDLVYLNHSNGGRLVRLRRLQSEPVGTDGRPRTSKFIRGLFVQLWRWFVLVGLGGWDGRPSPSSSTSSCESKWRAHITPAVCRKRIVEGAKGLVIEYA
jgi:hypothetical protein